MGGPKVAFAQSVARQPVRVLCLLAVFGCDQPRDIAINDNPLECASFCFEMRRECSQEACCDCTEAGGRFTVQESYPPSYGCFVGPVGDSVPVEGFVGSSYCEWARCEQSLPTPVHIDDEGRLGDLARAELDKLVGSHRSALEWTPDGQHAFELNVPDQHTQVTMEVAYNGGLIVVQDSRAIIPEGESPDWVVCEPEISIELDVGIRSDDGMLDAELAVQYVSSPFPQFPEFERKVSLAELSDTLEIRWEGQPVTEPLELELWVVAGPGGWLYAEGDGTGPVARWWPL